MSWETWRIKQTPNQQIGNHLVVTQLIPRWPLLGQKNFFYPVINELRGRWSQGQQQTTNGWSCLNPKSFFFVRTKDWTPLYLSIGGHPCSSHWRSKNSSFNPLSSYLSLWKWLQQNLSWGVIRNVSKGWGRHSKNGMTCDLWEGKERGLALPDAFPSPSPRSSPPQLSNSLLPLPLLCSELQSPELASDPLALPPHCRDLGKSLNLVRLFPYQWTQVGSDKIRVFLKWWKVGNTLF